MNEFFPTISLLLLLIIRIAVPITLTFFFSWILKELDTKWRKEVEEIKRLDNHVPKKTKLPCWVANGCSEDARKECRAFINPLMPCWDLFRSTDGRLSLNCQKCQYRN